MTKEQILEKLERCWFSEELEMENENCHISWKYVLQAMEQYKNNWIPFSEKKPQDYKEVMYFDSRDNFIHTGHFVCSQTKVEDYYTHWMELPNKPITL